jgi:hypothetical protein
MLDAIRAELPLDVQGSYRRCCLRCAAPTGNGVGVLPFATGVNCRKFEIREKIITCLRGLPFKKLK